MSKYVIANAAYADHGKSSSIKAFARLVQSKYQETFKLIKGSELGDVMAYVTINGKLVGIESQGDPSSRQGDSLNEFVEKNCDFIVVASRLRGETYNNVVELSKKGYNIIWCTNDSDACRDKNTIRVLNERYAERVLTLIMERI